MSRPILKKNNILRRFYFLTLQVYKSQKLLKKMRPEKALKSKLTLYKHGTTLYRTLIYTVHFCTSLYVFTDLYCTVLNNTVRFERLVIYSTEPHCTGNRHALYTERVYRYTLYTTVKYTTHYNLFLFFFFIILLNQIYLIYRVRLVRFN